MLEIKKFTFNPFEENTYLVYDTNTLEAWIIDPGCYTTEEQRYFINSIEKLNLTVSAIINTHCHVDHVLGNYALTQHFKVPLMIGEFELETLKSVKVYAPIYGFAAYHEKLPEQFMKHGQGINLGSYTFEIRHVPGHSAGHIALIQHQMKWCISGDVLFEQSIGRTDLPGGDYQTLISSINAQLLSLQDDYIVYCGHGNNTTIGKERKFNPFLQNV